MRILKINIDVMIWYTGLPVQVRDAALKLQESMPKSDVNKEYYTQNMEREVSLLYLKMVKKAEHRPFYPSHY